MTFAMCINNTFPRQKKDTGDETTWENKKKKIKQRWMDCVNRYMGVIGRPEAKVRDRTGCRRIASAAATPQLSGSG